MQLFLTVNGTPPAFLPPDEDVELPPREEEEDA